MNDYGEPLAHLLARLPDAEADPGRTARVLERCRAALTRRTAQPAARPARTVESLCIGGLCLAYLIAVVQHAL